MSISIPSLKLRVLIAMDSTTASTPATPNTCIASITVQQLIAPNAPRKMRPASAPSVISNNTSARKRLDFD